MLAFWFEIRYLEGEAAREEYNPDDLRELDIDQVTV